MNNEEILKKLHGKMKIESETKDDKVCLSVKCTGITPLEIIATVVEIVKNLVEREHISNNEIAFIIQELIDLYDVNKAAKQIMDILN